MREKLLFGGVQIPTIADSERVFAIDRCDFEIDSDEGASGEVRVESTQIQYQSAGRPMRSR